MKLFRFSLLELLWMCGVFAVFLGLNLQMTALKEYWWEIDGDGHAYYHTYTSEAGWPAPFFHYDLNIPPIQTPNTFTEADVQKLKAAHCSDVELVPGYAPGMTTPEITRVWNEGRVEKHLVLLNLFFALALALLPLMGWRLFMKRLQPEITAKSVN